MVQDSSKIEARIPLAAARKHPLLRKENGTHPDLSTIFRWAMRGVRGHKLTVTRVGGRIYTTERDIADFLQALNQTVIGPNQSPNREREISAARQRLAGEGVM